MEAERGQQHIWRQQHRAAAQVEAESRKRHTCSTDGAREETAAHLEAAAQSSSTGGGSAKTVAHLEAAAESSNTGEGSEKAVAYLEAAAAQVEAERGQQHTWRQQQRAAA